MVLQLDVDEFVAKEVRQDQNGFLSLFVLWIGEICRDCETSASQYAVLHAVLTYSQLYF